VVRGGATVSKFNPINIRNWGWRGDYFKWGIICRTSRGGGELGLISLNFDGPVCNSGNRGSLEQYTSVQAIRRDTGLEPAELAEKALAGDEKAIEYWQEYGKLLGIGLANLIYVLTPEAIILGGGISAGADLFFPAMKAELEQRVLFSSREGLEILIAELGNQAGMIGAAKLAFQKFVRIEDQIDS